MKPEEISNAVGELDEKIVEEADNARTSAKSEKKPNKRRSLWITIGAAAACLGIVGGIAAMNNNMGNDLPLGVRAAAQAVYPEMAKYPNENSLNFQNEYDNWWNDRKAQRCTVEGYADNLWDFYGDSTRQFLSGVEENRVYSPVNLYMALSMLAEITDNDSRQQILDLLAAENIEALRTQAGQVWNANYCDDGAITSIMGNSVWLDESLDYRQDVLNRLAENYYASGYYGSFGSEEMNTALRSWLNDQTGGLLKDAVDNVELPPAPETVMALYSTLLFKGKWFSEFDPAKNDTKTFHTPGGDIQTEFMNKSDDTQYYCGEDFAAIYLNFASDCGMWLILPDEDKSVDIVLESGEYMELVKSKGRWENSKFLMVDYSLPKFDVSSTIDLNDGLQALGISDVFNAQTADFSLLNGDNSEVFLGKASHSARVKIDEEGCEAAAFTEMLACGATMPPDEHVSFVLDRPFLFVISGMDGQPLFTGTVYQP
ncbi:MAG: serpin family protein [Oscillospiraceae bacterium]